MAARFADQGASDDVDDDTMIRLMADENATQSGAHPGAILNELVATTPAAGRSYHEGRDLLNNC